MAFPHSLEAVALNAAFQILKIIVAHQFLAANIQRQEDLLLPGSAVSLFSCFRINPNIEFGGRHYVAFAEESACHINNAFSQRSNFRSLIKSSCQVSTAADSNDGYFARMLFDSINDEISSMFLLRVHNRLIIIILAVFSLPGCRLRIACSAQMGVMATAVNAFFFLHVSETVFADGFINAHIYRDIGAADALQLTDGGSGTGFNPGIAYNDGNTLQIHFGRFGKHHHSDAVIKQIHHICIQNNLFTCCSLCRQRSSHSTNAHAHGKQQATT